MSKLSSPALAVTPKLQVIDRDPASPPALRWIDRHGFPPPASRVATKIAMRQQDGEFLAAGAADERPRSRPPAGAAAKGDDDGVAGRVTMPVIDPLEMVEVRQHDAERRGCELARTETAAPFPPGRVGSTGRKAHR